MGYDHKNTQYKQCLLHRKGKIMVTWLPLKFAKKNKVLELKNNGKWTDGWTVVTEFGDIIDEEKRQAISTQWTDWRKVTDV